jgi:hypothetical protein
MTTSAYSIGDRIRFTTSVGVPGFEGQVEHIYEDDELFVHWQNGLRSLVPPEIVERVEVPNA